MTSEIRFVKPLVIGCAVVIGIFHFAYWKEFTTLARNELFIIVDILGLLGFLWVSYRAWKLKDTMKDNASRWLVAIVTVVLCIWVGAWCSQYRADKSSGIEYKYSK